INKLSFMDGIYKLKGVVQHYSWGGTEFIPELIGVNNTDSKPFAEYWLGAHANASSVLEEENILLHELICHRPVEILGESVAKKFGSLPYLFKILDVKQMLSIQVHPSKKSAEEGFVKENEKGISLKAPNRNYKDKNHKPELMVALSDFWLLHGFKNEEDLKTRLERVSELNFLSLIFQAQGYKGLYEEVMAMPQQKVDEVLTPLMQRIIPQYNKGELQKANEDFWAARAALSFCKNDNYDRGIFSIYLFNLLYLKEGEAIYQPAGLPHAYLEGQNVEVMANSDNVLRAGLTDKHVDVPELIKHVKFEATYPKIIKASSDEEQSFDAPVEEFLLKRHKINNQFSFTPENTTIVFVYDGEGKFSSGEKNIHLKKGGAALILGGTKMAAESNNSLILYSVTTPR
ncbi:MAG: mannose-6-phosphate isomerase, class I, partial [Bacteroidia bacterium]